jgi:hypothetical protein
MSSITAAPASPRGLRATTPPPEPGEVFGERATMTIPLRRVGLWRSWERA